MTVQSSHIQTPTRVSVDTLSEFLEGTVEPIYQKDIMFGGLKANGRMTFNEAGVDMDWRVRHKRRELTEAEGYDQGIAAPRTTTAKRAVLPWRRFRMAESVTKFEKKANRGTAQLHDVVGELSEECVGDFMQSYRKQFFKDGNATGSKTVHGLESVFSYSGTVTDNARLGAPNDLYGGLYTTLNYYGGSWSPDSGGGWPTAGGGDACSTEYCFWAPMILLAQSTSWSASTKTWENTWQECLRYSMAFIEQLQDMAFDMCLMNPTMLLRAKQSLESTQRFELTQNSPLTEMGFRTLAYEGIELASAPHVGVGVTYLFRWDNLTLRNMLREFIEPETDYDPEDSSDLYYFDNFSNLQIGTPAFCSKIVDSAS